MSTQKQKFAPVKVCNDFKVGARAKHYRGWSTGFNFGGRPCFFFAPSKTDLEAFIARLENHIPLQAWSVANFQNTDMTAAAIADAEAAAMKTATQ